MNYLKKPWLWLAVIVVAIAGAGLAARELPKLLANESELPDLKWSVGEPLVLPSDPSINEEMIFAILPTSFTSPAGLVSWSLDGVQMAQAPFNHIEENIWSWRPGVNITSGPHVFRFCIDATNIVRESNEENNCKERNVTISRTRSLRLPDLVASLESDPNRSRFSGPIPIGEIVTVDSAVDNKGRVVNKRHEVSFAVDGAKLGQQSGLAVLGKYFKWSWRPTTTGRHTLRVCADAGKAIAESNERNNCATKTVTVVAPGSQAPDLVIKDVFGISPGRWAAGETVELSAAVNNRGNSGAGGNKVTLSVNGVEQSNSMVRPLAANTTSDRFTLTWATPASGGGRYAFKICADATRQVSEINENNNCSEKIVSFGSDLLVDLFEPTGRITEGDTVLLVARVQNEAIGGGGPNTANPVIIQLKVDGTEYSRHTTPAIARSNSWTWRPGWPDATAGRHTFAVCVDPGNNFPEIDEHNNCAEKVITVSKSTQGQLYPPLPVSADPLSLFKPDLIPFNSNVWSSGAQISQTFETKIKNQGMADFTTQLVGGDVRFRIDKGNDGTWDYERRSASVSEAIMMRASSSKIKFTVTSADYVGTNKYEFCVDPNSLVDESNEENNCWSGTVTIRDRSN